MDRVRPIERGVRLAIDLDRVCKPERGDAVRGLYGRAAEGNSGELGEGGSVDRRIVGGFRLVSASFETTRSDGKGEERNSSILSVSGTGSITAHPNKFKYASCRCKQKLAPYK
ncbi:hypothetical protein RRF57_000369 [Xylaria bambusicola]|uniref:Uncharacterized protein n=1 Tax=Xylaria bambusicola TaxID=326684 RepID=A0AAN7Z2G4_9PEZI